MLLSSEPLISTRGSRGENATALTKLACPISLCLSTRARESAVTVQTSTRFFPVTVSSVADAAWRTSDEKQTLLTHPDAPCAVQQHEMVVS